MKRNMIFTLLAFLCFLLQSTLLKKISFGGITPNLMVILISSVGFMKGRKAGLTIGFFCGILQDIFFGDVIGFYSLLYLYIGFGNGIFRKYFYPEDIRMPIALIAISDFTYSLLCYILQFLLNAKFNFGFYLKDIILPQMVYTIIVTIVVYPLILMLHKKLETQEKRSEKKFV